MKLVILGVTGSIGTSALKAVDKLNAQGFNIIPVLFSAHTNIEKLLLMSNRYGVTNLLITGSCPAETEIKDKNILHNVHEYREFLKESRPDRVLIAQVGAAALPYVLATIDEGIDIALANKESLVIAGDIINKRLVSRGVRIFPVDSEHSALFQCLEKVKRDSVSRIILTASGGPFYNRTFDELKDVTFEEAASHPVWNMGAKISVDSATMMNKALEIIEAHYLFRIVPEKIEVVIHPQSIVHSMIETVDGSIIAQLAIPDMQLPIAYALTYPERGRDIIEPIDFSRLTELNFQSCDKEKFPAIELAYISLKKGGGTEAVMNAANEESVYWFSQKKLKFTEIVPIVHRAIDRWQPRQIKNVDDVLAADRWAREFVRKEVNI